MKPSMCATDFDVDRRIGGLEIKIKTLAAGKIVDRRIGGLEILFELLGFLLSVDRRIGGLENEALNVCNRFRC